MSSRIVQTYTTAKDTELRLTAAPQQPLRRGEPSGKSPTVRIHPERRKQTLLGFGGAFTEAMADALSRVGPDRRREALEAYFHPDHGIGYTFCRTHINSCDFSLENYSYCDVPGDVELEHFDISRDTRTLIPLIRDAGTIRGRPLTLFASPWSPPAWMKTSGRMNHGGRLKREYYPVWARYFVRYIRAYRDQGIPIWGVTIQNEPLAVTKWDNCVYTHAEEREFVKVLARAFHDHGLDDVKIIVWDHNKDVLKERTDVIFADLDAYDATWGVGFHWYGPTDTESTIDDSALDYVHKCYPDKKLIFTEGCNPVRHAEGLSGMLGAWWTGEKYARHVIADLNHHTAAWVDWNMVLDERGGPNHVGNFCDAPIIADTVNDRLVYESSFYCLGHFSRFIPPGSTCLGSEVDAAELQAVAAERPDGAIVLVVLNTGDRPVCAEARLNDAAWWIEMPPRSIQTHVVPHKRGPGK